VRASKHTLVGALLMLGVLSGLGCGGAARSREGTRLDATSVPGTLVARVAGHPRDIRYFIDGKHFDPDYEIEWWRDARFEVELPPGAYEVTAEYRVRAFAGDGETYRIVAPAPVAVHSGRVTVLYARIDKDYRGVPKRQTESFSVLYPTRATSEDPGAEDIEAEPPPPEPHGALRARNAARLQATDVVRIRGGRVQVEPAGRGQATSIPGSDIRVRGTRVDFAAGDAPIARPDAGSTLAIRRSRVTQSAAPTPTAPNEDAGSTARLRVRGTRVERGGGPSVLRADPEGGNALRIWGSQVDQETAPSQSTPGPEARAESIRIRGARVSREAAPAPGARPAADAPAESIQIRGTRVTRG